jgi:F-type H+-transporting ATPase subunit a
VTFAAYVQASDRGPYIPSPSTFDLPPIFEVAGLGVTKPMIAFALSVPLIVVLFWAMSRRAAVVPGRLQFAGELAYGFVRNIGRDNIGSDEFRRFMPLLFSLFFLVAFNNYFGLIPVFPQFPTFSRIGFAVGLALVVWLVYNGVGIGRHGLFGYLKLQTVPGGVRGPILLLVVPLEFISNILIRPATLALRVFATMFAGHLLLVLFSMGAAYMAIDLGGAYIAAAVGSGLLFVMVGFLEVLIMFLQAYVFTLLTSIYIGGALAEEH